MSTSARSFAVADSVKLRYGGADCRVNGLDGQWICGNPASSYGGLGCKIDDNWSVLEVFRPSSTGLVTRLTVKAPNGVIRMISPSAVV